MGWSIQWVRMAAQALPPHAHPHPLPPLPLPLARYSG